MSAFGPVVAGSFYPANPSELKQMVESFIDSADVDLQEGRILGFISPHAGYIYSGKVAGYVFNLLKQVKPKRVIVMAPSHRVPSSRVGVLNVEYYRTPLGEVKIDKEGVRKLLSYPDVFVENERMFAMEHSMEVQLPFIQVVLPDVSIVPIVVGVLSRDMIRKAGAILFEEFGSDKETVIVVSSDMSHYYPYDIAVKMDTKALELLKTLDADELLRKERTEEIQFCGIMPIAIFLDYISHFKGVYVDVLKYLNSGDTAGDKSQVVGYGAVAFYQKGPKGGVDEVIMEPISDDDKKELLRIARLTLEEYVKHKKVPQVEVKSERLKKPQGAFVTLKIKGELRGCIGRMISDMRLYKVVQEMTVHSCSKDPRFFPVREDELPDIDIEISVLSPMVKVDEPRSVVVGRDGLVVRKGFYQGVLLPQVPVEENWDLDTYLKMICKKAGLPEGCVFEEGTELFRFEAIVFSEKEMGMR